MKQRIIERMASDGDEHFFAVPGGEMQLGADEADIGRITINGDSVKREYLLSAAPRRSEHVAPFRIGRSLVSREDFSAFIDDTGYRTDAEREGWAWISRDGMWEKREGLSWRNPFGGAADEFCAEHGGQLPVFQASWNDAAAFCRWLSNATGKRVSLPDEGQWETFGFFRGVPGLVEISSRESSPLFSDHVAYCAAVLSAIDGGECPPGVLWEWCLDWFDAYPGGRPHREYGEVYKVLRGGSLQSNPLQRAREYRFRRCPTARSPYYGFRIIIG